VKFWVPATLPCEFSGVSSVAQPFVPLPREGFHPVFINSFSTPRLKLGWPDFVGRSVLFTSSLPGPPECSFSHFSFFWSFFFFPPVIVTLYNRKVCFFWVPPFIHFRQGISEAPLLFPKQLNTHKKSSALFRTFSFQMETRSPCSAVGFYDDDSL